jgi:hypothetical protein
MAELGIEEPGLNRVIRAGYQLLNLQTYFTAGVKEVRAGLSRLAQRRLRPQVKSTLTSKKALSVRKPSLMKTLSPTKVSKERRKRAKCVLKVKITS